MQQPLIVNKRKRKNWFWSNAIPIISGLSFGTIFAFGVIFLPKALAQEEETAGDKLDRALDYISFEWQDVFSPSGKGQNMYELIYNKLLIRPEKNALKEVAQKYGLTQDEADQVVHGSAAAIFNNSRNDITDLTQEDAYVLITSLQSDFADLKEIFDLEQELDTALSPSEIFSNGDLEDSGFDLIHDLDVIEEILFVNKTKNTVGDDFGGSLASPYLPTEDESKTDYFVENRDDVAVLTLPSGLELEENEVEEAGEIDGNFAAATLQIGEKEIDVEILEQDVCRDESLGVPDKNQALKDSGNFEKSRKNLGDEGLGAEENRVADGEDEKNLETAELPLSSALEIPPGEWSSVFCPAFGEKDPNNRTASTFGEHGFSSPGDSFNSLVGQSAGAFSAIDSPGISAHIALCVTTELIEKTYATYDPGQGCVACEIDEISQILNRTFYHSLIPNKVTGNIFESAKCKKSYTVADLLDIQFITIAAPIPTPSNADLIFGNNIFEEWNSFIDETQPFTEYFDGKFKIENSLESFDSGERVDQEGFLREIRKLEAVQKSQAAGGVLAFEPKIEAGNFLVYSQAVLGEIQQMTAFFQHFKELFDNLNNNVCPAFAEKETLD